MKTPTVCRHHTGVFLLVLLLVLASPAWAVKFVWFPGALDTWLSSASTLANGARLLSTTIFVTNTGYTKADCELTVPSFSGAVAANGAVSLWILRTLDNTNYGDGDPSTDSPRLPDVVFPLRAVSTAQRVIMSGIDLPPEPFKALVRNDTGVTMNATWTLKCLNYVQQSQ